MEKQIYRPFFRSIWLGLLCGSMTTAAAGVDVATGIQLAQIDFDTYHALLLERCKTEVPDSVGALAEAMVQWRARNADALVILRQLYKAQLIRQMRARQPAATEAEIDAHVAAVMGLFNGGLKDKVAAVPPGEARASCAGEYANNLQTHPDMDFNELLKRMTLGR